MVSFKEMRRKRHHAKQTKILKENPNKTKYYNVVVSRHKFEKVIFSTHREKSANILLENLQHVFGVIGEAEVRVRITTELRDTKDINRDIIVSKSTQLDRITDDEIKGLKDVHKNWFSTEAIGTLVSLELSKVRPFDDYTMILDRLSDVIDEREGMRYAIQVEQLVKWMSSRKGILKPFQIWLCRKHWTVTDPLIAIKTIQEAKRSGKLVSAKGFYQGRYLEVSNNRSKGFPVPPSLTEARGENENDD